MTAEVVHSATDGADVLQGQLFNGMTFWLSAKVPQRSRFIQDLKANGGNVTLLEQNADVKIVDHAKKEALPGTYSYTFIEKSIREGVLENLANHTVGPVPGTIRNVASVSHPAKVTRQKYTDEDERILWDWVNTNPQTGGGTDGNEIYKQLEMKHPQHPWQSWRDHYRKSMKGRTRPIYPPNNAPPTPPLEPPTADTGSGQEGSAHGYVVDDFGDFSEEDEEILMEHGQDIMKVRKEDLTAAWTRWANEADVEKQHTAQQWQAFWERRILPRFLRRESKKAKRSVDASEPTSKRSVPDIQPKSRDPPSDKAKPKALSSQRALPQHVQLPQLAETPVLPVLQTTGGMVEAEPTEDVLSPLGKSILKRKRLDMEELPSSSPPSAKSPSRAKRTARKTNEIASTPDQSPRRYNEERYQPLFLGDLLEADADNRLRINHEGGNSPLGQQPSESLSEPDRTARASTQALLRGETPYIDFDVALPEGGWDGDEEADHADKSESESDYGSPRKQAPLPDTQAIFQDKTQIPDLSVPDPDDPWISLVPPSSPPLIMPSSPVALSESSSAQQAHLDEKIDNLVKDRMEQGFSAPQILAVLESTCTNIALTEQVLQHMGLQNGAFVLPNDIKGVWTAQDDSDLRSSDARKVGRLEPKHGADGVNARYEWLELMASRS